MFFNIGHSKLSNYPCHWQLENFVVSTDNGWTLTTVDSKQVLYKGYADIDSLHLLLEQIVNQTEPVFTGNFCALVADKQSIQIKTDRYRGFPIYIDQNINNLIPSERTAWTDSLITVNQDLTIVENKFDAIGKIDTSTILVSDALDLIGDILDQKTTLFLKHNRLPVRAFLSGGVDSMLVYSFLKKHTKDFELVKCSHVDWDYFYMKNSGSLKKHWAYSQIHHWINPCVLTSGTPGDEFMLRSPVTTDLFLKHHSINIVDLLDQPQWQDCLHSKYFSQDKHKKIFTTQEIPECTLEQLHWNLCNIVVNDWQHWHLGNTLTWTPLRDLEIFKIMMRLPVEDLLDQVLNSDFSVQLIERNCPGLSSAISDSKNNGNVLANLINVI